MITDGPKCLLAVIVGRYFLMPCAHLRDSFIVC